MRSFFLFLSIVLFTPLGLCASEWGLLPSFVEEETAQERVSLQDKRFLLSHIIAGEPIYYTLTTDDPKGTQRYHQLVTQAFNDWFEQTFEYIRRSGRKEEFKDIVPLLRRGIDMREAQEGQQPLLDISFIPLKQLRKNCSAHAIACVETSLHPLKMYLPTERWLFALLSFGQQTQQVIVTHEVGHTLGLSDQYRQARSQKSDTIFSADTDSSTIMDMKPHITCDDATGLINAIDLVRGTSRAEGWKGLCDTDIHTYQDGTVQNRSGYRFIIRQNQYIEMETYQNGKRTQTRSYDLDLQNTDSPFIHYKPVEVLLTDNNGRPLHASGPNGEDIYYAYVFDGKTELIIKGDKIKQFNRTYRDPKVRYFAPTYQRSSLFAQNGKICALSGELYANRAGEVSFLRGIHISDKAKDGYIAEETIIRIFGKRGKLETSMWQKAEEETFPSMTALQTGNTSPAGDPMSFQIKAAVVSAEQKNLYKQLDEWLFNLSDFF